MVSMGNLKNSPPWHPPTCAQMQALLPQYEFLDLIGRGGMGAVYKAVQTSLHRPVAIKCLPPDLLRTSEDSAERFRQEAWTMAQLNHPGIVSVFDSGAAGECLFIAMEYVDGLDLGNRLKKEGRLPEDEVIRLMIQACDAADYAHQHGVIHRDLKPTNLLLKKNGRLKIADFGLAKLNHESQPGLTQSDFTIGTPEFLPPEAWEPDIRMDARADIYSLGVTLYQLLTGDIPRGLWKMPSVKVGTDPRLDAVIDRAMQPDPGDRYPTAARMRSDLDLIQSTKPNSPKVDHQRQQGSERVSEGAPPSPSVSVGSKRLFPWRKAVWVLLPLLVLFISLFAFAPKVEIPSVRSAADWLLNEQAEIKILTERGETEVSSPQELPSKDFQISYLWFDRWAHGPPEPPPPAEEFDVLRGVTTLRVAFIRLPGLPLSALSFLSQNRDLLRLDIDCPESMTDEVFEQIQGLNHLEKLAIGHAPRITGRNLARSAWLKNIEELDLTGTAVGDEALQSLSRCHRLRQLRLEGTPITGLGLQALESIDSLRHLAAGSCRRLDDQDLARYLPKLKQLRKLELQSSQFGPEAAIGITALTNLTELHLSGSQLTDEGLALLSQLPRLEILSVRGSRVTRGGLRAFSEACPQIKLDR